ncbi:putative ATP-dependent endonuclease of the OLD family [Paenibacillus sp. 1_12]|uniref:ATP-dependent nuclease n=1 Tax=Paenibacillus sp. 1_12 TaxID=1566278 RepID=UPI0008E2E7D4|nr:AAA family ATPase [Paenibacillus sp. 1_12]SFM20912.1 putative ATP-dependent endonuclease of the OLD family [Paenibacillus sp. 1_12]
MHLSRVKLKNYRNFVDSEFNFNKKSLIIGANDVGKTNLLDSIRLLLDKSLSENDLEPTLEDFCALNDCTTFEILLQFSDITEDCVKAKFPGYISDQNELFIKYTGFKEGKRYELAAGRSEDELEEIKGRFYLKVLNLRYVPANRQIDNFLKNQKNKLLEKLKSNRTDQQVSEDESQLSNLLSLLTDVQVLLDKLSFVEKGGALLNKELDNLAEHHTSQEIKLGIDIPKSNDLFRKVQLLSYVNDHAIQLGGDGRKNQAFLALWAALNEIENSDGEPEEVSIFCIEEPEAHLHPHQQRRLSEYLINNLKTQVILTSHSPFIASEFQSESIVRLFTSKEDKSTKAAKKGASEQIKEKIDGLEFRLNVLSSEVYFSDCVFLVEGSSEVIFYKSLAIALGIELDRLNISILSVEGVGFHKYIELFDNLGIPWVIRTDNDYQLVSAKIQGNYYRLSGLQRAISVLKLKQSLQPALVEPAYFKFIIENEEDLTHLTDKNEQYRKDMYEKYYEDLKQNGIYIAKLGLEEDLFNTTESVRNSLRQYYKYSVDEYTDEEVIKKMKDKKSTNMFHFVKLYFDCLPDINGFELAQPLIHCKNITEELRRV